MILDKANLTAHVEADDVRTGRGIGGIALDKAGTVSTNGASMLIVPYPAFDPGDFPPHPIVDPQYMVNGTVEIITPDFCDAIAKTIPKSTHATSRHAAVSIKDGVAYAHSMGHGGSSSAEAKVIDATYPDWRRALPRRTHAIVRFHMALPLLIDTLKEMLKAVRIRGDCDVVEVAYTGPATPMVFRSGSTDASIVAAVMPSSAPPDFDPKSPLTQYEVTA